MQITNTNALNISGLGTLVPTQVGTPLVLDSNNNIVKGSSGLINMSLSTVQISNLSFRNSSGNTEIAYVKGETTSGLSLVCGSTIFGVTEDWISTNKGLLIRATAANGAYIQVFGYVNYTPPGQGQFAATPSLAGSIFAQGDVYTNGRFMAVSDNRIKINNKDVNNIDMLNIVKKLKVKTYNYKDTINNSSQLQTGFIAQEVKEILPHIVNTCTKEIPSIYAPATNISLSPDGNNVELSVTIPSTSELKIGGMVDLKIIYKNTTHVTNISALVVSFTDSLVIVPIWDNYIDTLNVFVYGAIVDDFHNLSKSDMVPLCVASIQELCNRIERLEKLLLN
jgi:hypothetical protein